jgi:hypothetical protein
MFRLLFPILVSLSIVGGQIASAQDKMEEILSSFGYVIKKSDSAQPTTWEKAQYQTLAKKVIKIKSVKAVPRMSNTFYRFTVIEERYADAGSAEMRLSRLREKPPDMGNPEDNKTFPLRTGFQYGNCVYVVSTDVSMFDGEMNRIAKALKALLR